MTHEERLVSVFRQELALHSFKEMVGVLDTESSVNNVGFMAVKDTVNSALGGIANVLQSSATLAAVDNAESQENITGYTGNSSFGGVVSVKDRVSNKFKLINIIFLREFSQEAGRLGDLEREE